MDIIAEPSGGLWRRGRYVARLVPPELLAAAAGAAARRTRVRGGEGPLEVRTARPVMGSRCDEGTFLLVDLGKRHVRPLSVHCKCDNGETRLWGKKKAVPYDRFYAFAL